MATLTRDRLTYLCATEEEATDLIEDFKASQDSEHYLLSCYKADFKKKKNKETDEEYISHNIFFVNLYES